MWLRFLIVVLLLSSCLSDSDQGQVPSDEGDEHRILVEELQNILDTAGVVGSILLLDQATNTFYSNDFEWSQQGHLPASTYKIPNSIIALETGVVTDASTSFPWDGEPRGLDIWEQDMVFREAFQLSCVPCYQDIARNIGAKRMNHFLEKLNFGSMSVDSTNIDNFWLLGESRITQFQQIDFLKRLYNSDLTISDRTYEIMSEIMLIKSTPHYKLSGKTGWSTGDQGDNGWFVGFLETGDNLFYFATNVEPLEGFNMDQFPEVRKEVTYDAFEVMGF